MYFFVPLNKTQPLISDKDHCELAQSMVVTGRDHCIVYMYVSLVCAKLFHQWVFDVCFCGIINITLCSD